MSLVILHFSFIYQVISEVINCDLVLNYKSFIYHCLEQQSAYQWKRNTIGSICLCMVIDSFFRYIKCFPAMLKLLFMDFNIYSSFYIHELINIHLLMAVKWNFSSWTFAITMHCIFDADNILCLISLWWKR